MRWLAVVVLCGCSGPAPPIDMPPPVMAPASAQPSVDPPTVEVAPVPHVVPAPSVDPAAPPPTVPDKTACRAPDTWGPIVIAPSIWEARRIARADTLAELETSREDPARTCGAVDTYRSIMALTCEDGSKPYSKMREVRAALVGEPVEGGICAHLIDRYGIVCPEKTYDVYVDMYWCDDADRWLGSAKPKKS